MTTPDTSIASRELDYYLAEHVCGWEWWCSSSSGRRCLFAPGAIPRQNLGSPEWFLERASGDEELVGDWDYSEKDIPAYSSSRSAAFELAWSFKRWNIRNSVLHIFMIEIYDEFYGMAEGEPEEFPLLVCRAALQAKGLL